MIIIVLLTKYLQIGSFITFKAFKYKTPIKLLNSLSREQINLEYFKINQTTFLEQLKLENEKIARNETLNLEHLKLENEKIARNETLNLGHLKIENEKIALENEKRSLNIKQLSIIVLIIAIFTSLQLGIYIRDGLMGKKSGEIALKTIASIVFSQFVQTADVIFKWAVRLLKVMRLVVSKFL